MIDFDDWCYHAVAQIRFKPDREAVFRELKAHLEDHYDDLLTQGHTPEKAQRLAMEAMGDPEDIAPQLGAIHKPYLGYLYSIIMPLAIAACTWALILLVAFTGSHIHAVVSTANYQAFRVEGDDCFYFEPNVTAASDGYRFKITEAALDANCGTLYLELQTIYWPWMEDSAIGKYFWAVDSLGNRYAAKAEAWYADVPKVTTGGWMSTSGFTSHNMEITHFDSAAEWVELRYDRDGRDIILRIDLTGGEEK